MCYVGKTSQFLQLVRQEKAEVVYYSLYVITLYISLYVKYLTMSSRKVKPIGLYSYAVSNNGGGDEASGLRAKAKVALNSNRNLKRRSITDKNRFENEDHLGESVGNVKWTFTIRPFR